MFQTLFPVAKQNSAAAAQLSNRGGGRRQRRRGKERGGGVRFGPEGGGEESAFIQLVTNGNGVRKEGDFN